jgi:hypothetical protein
MVENSKINHFFVRQPRSILFRKIQQGFYMLLGMIIPPPAGIFFYKLFQQLLGNYQVGTVFPNQFFPGDARSRFHQAVFAASLLL